jgi:hypothetical protein
MSNITPVDGVQVTPDTSLTDLAKIINNEHAAIGVAVTAALEDVFSHVLVLGRAARAAKHQVPKRQFGAWILLNCEIGCRQVQRCIKVVEAYESNATRVSHDELRRLSFRSLVSLLTPPKPRQQTQSDETKETVPPASIPPLNSLSWAPASLAERAKWVRAVGWQAIAEVIPADWRPAIEAWLHPKPALVVIDADGHPIPEDLSIPSFLKVVSPDGVTAYARRAANAHRQ